MALEDRAGWRAAAAPGPWLAQSIYSIYTVGDDKLAILKFACAAVLAIAILDAVSSYTEKYLTTSVSQWVTHDLRRTLYSRIHLRQPSLQSVSSLGN